MTGNKSMRLLIVDDEPGMLRTLKRIMSVKGFDVETAASGEEAVERTAAWRPDCILMDIRMPGMNGVEAFQRIKAQFPGTRVVFMTAYAGSSLVEEALREGGLGVYPKPLDIDALCGQIAAAAAERPLLVVDDDQAFCNSLARVLESKGFDVCTVCTFAEAIEAFRRRPRGVVLLDLKLNGASGLELLTQLREINPEIVAILMTGFADLQTRLQDMDQEGVRDCFLKPVDIDRLLETIG